MKARFHLYLSFKLFSRNRLSVITCTSPTARCAPLAQIAPEYAGIATELEVGLVDGKIRCVKATVGRIAAYDPDKIRVRV
ncbi:hypothetical protein [Gloeocapsopsis dulcis]|uniref:hypothetical protein n=1 Tax=Gloeocapsopsis dulcis TaxID=2859516 RepID=UPI00101ADA8C|nr:hypothetical protein [Gloeocapsopsis dulcis]WNN88564.1 hypothetical protein P0S91_20110 [Gloeocapsopsis dulcis]